MLFDLDGTLTDPVVGITTCIGYALTSMGAACPPLDTLARFVGPPLRPTFAHLLNIPEGHAGVEQAVAWYRERFGTVGLYENEIYPGVVTMLQDLRDADLRLFVATSKPHVFANRILAHFELDALFSGVHGSELDGRFDDKVELIAHLLETERLDPAECLMVGDRSYDVIGGRRNGVRALGVTYGFGKEDELRDAGADWVCESPEAVNRLIQGIARGEG